MIRIDMQKHNINERVNRRESEKVASNRHALILVFSVVITTVLVLLIFFGKSPLLTQSQCMQKQCSSGNLAEYSYTVTRHTDVNGEDLMHVQARDLEVVKKVCDLFESCAGFNSNGWLKTRVSIRVSGPADLYIKSESKSLPKSNSEIYSSSGYSDDYSEMLNKMKIYIYDTNIGQKLRTVRSGGYGVERAVIDQLLKSHFRTRTAEEATFYFIPIRCSSYILGSSMEEEGIMEARRYVGNMIEQIQTMYPYWRRSAGADHFYACSHDIGAGIGKDLLKNAIALVNTADYEDPYFIPHKDISLPPNTMHGPGSLPTVGKGGSDIDPKSRKILAFFAGNLASGRIRPTIQNHFFNDPDFTIIDREVSWSAYLNYLKQSRFCLVPRGREVWSPRLMDAVFYGCIPVILSDHYHLPLQGIVNWSEFSVIVPESQVAKLKSILLNIPDSKIAAMQNVLKRVYIHFVWNNPAQPHDAFYSVMYQLWKRRDVVRYSRK
uniref:probable glycosyltransferase At3g07620 n=1 Tax=Styela clava TaxID=7725 RepID=UPI0019396DB4|nr:probable glycosyltransferase At3g07620 [Styela clava]